VAAGLGWLLLAWPLRTDFWEWMLSKSMQVSIECRQRGYAETLSDCGRSTRVVCKRAVKRAKIRLTESQPSAEVRGLVGLSCRVRGE
jgi:hypothetical protein